MRNSKSLQNRGMDENNYLIIMHTIHHCRNVINKCNLSSQQPYKKSDIILTLNMKKLKEHSPKAHNLLTEQVLCWENQDSHDSKSSQQSTT